MAMARGCGRPWLAFAYSSSLIIAHHPNSSSVAVSAVAWDFSSNRFLVSQNWRLNLTGDLQLLAGGVVSDDELGLCRAYIIIGKKSSIWIGRISHENESVECEVELSLMDLCSSGKRSSSFNASKILEGQVRKSRLKNSYNLMKHTSLESAVAECWLFHGPMVLCLYKHRVLIAYAQPSLADSNNVSSQWAVDVLEVSGNVEKQLKIHVCGTEAVVSISDNSKTSDGASRSWSYFSLDTQNRNASFHWKVVPVESILKPRSDVFPTDLDPSLISCVASIPPTSSETVSRLFSNNHLPGLPSDVLVGTFDKRFIRCRNGKVVNVIDVEDVPKALCFAVVTGGQGALFAEFNTKNSQAVVALCAETHQRLQVWPGVCAAFPGDFQRMGHEQVALLSYTRKSAPSAINDFLKLLSITDVNMESTECEEHKTTNTRATIKLLQGRAKAGRLQLEKFREQKMEKVELLRSSCDLLQEVTHKHLHKSSIAREHKSKFAHVEKISYYTCRNQVVITVHLHNVAPRGMTLRNASLLITSVQGHLEGISSMLDELNRDDGIKELLVAVPLGRVHIYTLQAISILLSAEVFDRQSPAMSTEENEAEELNGVKRRLTEWLSRVDTKWAALMESVLPKQLPLSYRGVTKERQFLLTSSTKEWSKLPDFIKSVLHMDTWKAEGKSVELVGSTWFHFVGASISPTKGAAILTLRAEDSQQLSLLQQLLLMGLNSKSEFRVLPVHCSPDGLAAMGLFTESFRRELAAGRVNRKSQIYRELETDRFCICLLEKHQSAL